MKKNLFTFTFLIFCVVTACAQQTPFLQWQKTYGTGFNFAKWIEQTSDNGYIMAGTDQFNPAAKEILKLDANGNLEWQNAYSGASTPHCVRQTSDGGYIVAGGSIGHNSSQDYGIVKLNADGSVQWQKDYGGYDYDFANGVAQTSDGGYIVVGESNSTDGDVTNNHGDNDYWILKLNAGGDLIWQKSLGGSNYDMATSVVATTDGGCIVAGYSWSTDGDITDHHGDTFDDDWIVKLDALGNVSWKKSYGGSWFDEANSIKQTSDGGYIIAGSSRSSDGDVSHNNALDDYWVLKLNSTGNIEWESPLGGKYEDDGYSVDETSDGGYVVAGKSRSSNGDKTIGRGKYDLWILKLNHLGVLQWQKSLGGTQSDGADCVKQTSDGGFILAGYTNSSDENVTNTNGYDYWIVKLSPENLNDNIHINPYHTSADCSSANSVSCTIKNAATAYTVRLYRFGVLYDSALNVIGHVGFHNLCDGAYYLTATDQNGIVSCSEEADIVPSPYNLNTTNITATTAQLNWTGFDCADAYKIQFHIQGTTEWEEKVTTGNKNNYTLNNLLSSTTYVWRIASEKRESGIKATGEFSDSVTFTTASSIVSSASNASASTLNSNQLNVSPNPAKNSFKIFFNTTSANKINAMLYDVNGKAVWSSGVMNASSLNNKTVRTTAFARGVYYLKLMNEDGRLVSAIKIFISN